MAYTGQQHALLAAAAHYHKKGYSVGLAKGKAFVEQFLPSDPHRMQTNASMQFDGISVIPDGIVCVDFDEPDFGLIDEPLPPTWKERTRRGWHLFYRLPVTTVIKKRGSAKIAWRKHVDLLVKTDSDEEKVVTYGRGAQNDEPWMRHVLVSPTEGYQLIWPEEVPTKQELTEAPDWIIDAILK